jgi:hypothetical protein
MITIIWQTNKENSWECDWIEHLFQKTEHKTITDYNQTQFIDRSYIVYNAGVNNDAYINSLSKSGKKFGLIHLSDEWDKDSTANYSLADVVLRNYYKDLGPTVINFPLGWMNSFPHTISPKPISGRKYVWSFSGHVDKTTRPMMAEYMSKIPDGIGYFKKCGENWGPFQGHALTPTQLAEMYNDSIFVPCPQGNQSIDSFRVTEALQAGALPIVERSEYWSNLFGQDHPLIEIDSWDQAPAIVANLTQEHTLLEQKRSATYTWWIKYCDNLQNTIKGLL